MFVHSFIELELAADSRLDALVGRVWLAMQDAHDLWVARQNIDLGRVRPLDLAS
jgi:plasmid maintenance system antidote protein VapI